MRLPSPPLLLISDRSQARTDLVEIVRTSFAAGCRWTSLREKDLPASAQTKLLKALLLAAKPCGARVTLHGDPRLARDAGADGVHLPAGNDPAAARRLLGRDALIGLSIHHAGETEMLEPVDVDYVLAGPVFVTQSKPGYGPALGPEGLALIVNLSPVPVIAIGGITPENAGDCLVAGAAGVAVMGGIIRAENPGEVTTQLVAALAASQPRPR
ncbi:MAG TPA: thiamine phosphate synthase [Xanthobacteraceae bacterium]|nr:thiamine phosphate synthase [Xanthobacteraceae bacterium]